MKKVLLLFLLGVISTSAYFATEQYLSESSIATQDTEYPIPSAMAISPNPCTMTMNQVAERANFAFKIPRSMPTTHSIQDSFGQKGEVALYYAPGTMCGDDAQYKTFEDGIIQYYTATADSTKAEQIAMGVQFFKQYKEGAPIPDKVKLFEINGMPAMGWESGLRESLVIDHDGTVIQSEDIPHPAQIRVVDTNGNVLYVLKGNLPLDQMKSIMSNTLG